MRRLCPLLALLLACAPKETRTSADPPEKPADLVLENAHVFGRSESSLAIRDGKLVRGVSSIAAREHRDLHGAWIYPGLRDAHVHLAAYGDGLLGRVCDLSATTSQADALSRVRAHVDAKALGPEDWVVCQGWNEGRWNAPLPGSTTPLDDAVGGRPAVLLRQDGHTAWVSKRALAIGGVTRDTTLRGGEVTKDDKGDPSGVLTDNALGLVRRHEPAPTEAELEASILRGLDECAKLGLVEVHDALVLPRVARVFEKLANEGKLRLRVSAMIWLPTAEQLERYMEENAPITAPIHGRLVIRTVKVFADGALGGGSAHLVEPYANRPNWRGLGRTTREEIAAIARIALRRGWQVATHAIGDAAVKDVLDGYAEAGVTPSARFRIEHAAIVRDEDVGRFASMGLIASMQTGLPGRPQAQALGTDRMKHLWDVDRLARAGIRVALGTDVPPGITAEPLNAMRAVNRRGMSREDAVRAASEGAAFAAFAENERGSIRDGLAADLTIYDKNPFEAKDAKVVGRFVGGTSD